MMQIERVEPFLTFEVIVEDEETGNLKILNIKSLSYETNGEYVTFYQKIIASETIPSPYELKHRTEVKKYVKKLIEVHKNDIPNEILDELKHICDKIEDKQIVENRKMPFLTLCNVRKITILNAEEDKFELIKEVGEIYQPKKQHIIQKQIDTTINEIETSSNPINNLNVKNNQFCKIPHKITGISTNIKATEMDNIPVSPSNSFNQTNDKNNDSNVISDYNQNDVDNDFNDENHHYPMDDENLDEMAALLAESNDDSFAPSDDDLQTLLNDSVNEHEFHPFMEDNNVQHDSDSFKEEDGNDEVLKAISSAYDESNIDFNHIIEHLNSEEYKREEERREIESQQSYQAKLDDILNKVSNRVISEDDEHNYLSSVDERNNKSEKYQLIKSNLDEYLKMTSAQFNIRSFYENYIRERTSQQMRITEDDVIIQICMMIKNKEININRFNDSQKQSIIDKHKDIIQIYNDGDLQKLLGMINRRSEETRKINMIDLVVYMRKNNYFK